MNAEFQDPLQKEFLGGLVAPEITGTYWFLTKVSNDGGRFWMVCGNGEEGNAVDLVIPGILTVNP